MTAMSGLKIFDPEAAPLYTGSAVPSAVATAFWAGERRCSRTLSGGQLRFERRQARLVVLLQRVEVFPELLDFLLHAAGRRLRSCAGWYADQTGHHEPTHEGRQTHGYLRTRCQRQC